MAVLKTLTRGTVKLLVGLLLLLAGFYLLLLAINWQDAKPNAASLHMQSLLQQPAIPAERNGYQYYLAHNANSELLLSGPLQQLYSQCSEAQACKEALIAQTDLAALIAEQEPLMTFYQQLLQYPQWQEPAPKIKDMPAYQMLLHGQRLFLWQAWLDAQAGNSEHVKAALTADYQFWKNLLSETNSLITKLISTAALEHHFNLGTVIISQLPADQRATAMPEFWTSAFSARELSMEQVLAGEWHYAAELTSSGQDAAPFVFGGDGNALETALIILARPLLLQQDTKNIHATQLRQPVQQVTYPWYSWLRNPVGKLLVVAGNPPYTDYQQRLLQLEQLRIMALQQPG